MRRCQVYALGQDAYWLKAVTKATDEVVTVETIRYSANNMRCLDRLPEVDPEALLLVDATRQPDVAAMVKTLREQGWRYVVAVAADPSWKEARTVLREGAGHDYWEKSYVPQVIRRDIERCLAEIARAGK